MSCEAIIIKQDFGIPGSVDSFSAGTTGFIPNIPTSGAIVLDGTLVTGHGGTGLTSFTAGKALYATSTSVLTTGDLPITGGGTGVAGFGLVTAKTSNDTLTAAQSYQTFTNEGASGSVTLSLPTPVAGLEFTFAVVAAQSFVVDVIGSVVIALGPGIESTAGGQISANEPGAFVTLKCLSATRWQAIAGAFGWTPS